MSNEKDANEILPNIWLGNYKAAHNANFIYKFNIKYIINVTPDIKNIHKNVNYLQIPIKDLDACPNRDLFEIFEKTSDTEVLIITELPLHKWTEDYKSEVLKKLKENGTIRKITKDNCTDKKVYLEIELNSEKVKDAEEEGFEKIFQLTSPLVTSNMICFDSNNQLAKYNSPEGILNEFYGVRLNLYVERRVRSYIILFFFGIHICIYFHHD